MLLILPAALAILVAAGALAWRASEGQQASVFNSQTLGARKTAEMGISRLIADWNRPENRMLLASGSPAANWVDTPANPVLRNPCTATTTTAATAIGATDLASYRTGAWISIDATRRYRLRRVSFRNWNRTSERKSFTQAAFGSDLTSGNYPDMSTNTNTASVARPFSLGDTTNSNASTNPAQNTFGYLEVEMEGQVIRGTTVLASSRMVKEFQVVPKCCGLSFGRTLSVGNPPTFETYGNDWRKCDGIPFSPKGAAVLIGLDKANGGGLQQDSGNSWTLRVAGTSPPERASIYCTQATQYCDGTDANSLADSSAVVIDGADGNIGVNPFNITIPNPPTIPTSGFTTSPTNNASVNGGGALVASPANAFNNSITLPQVTSSNSYCGYKTGVYHCRISSINLTGNKTVTINSTAAPVFLYLQGDINTSGNSGFSHTSTVDRFRIFGKPTGSSAQDIELSGASGNTSVFIWAPVATLDLGGSSTYTAITWVNNLKLGGNPTVIVPAGVDSCPVNPPANDPLLVYCRLLRDGSSGSSGSDLLPLNFDWVARSETSTRFYGD